MITPLRPELVENKDREEVRKALIDLARQLNEELQAIRERLDAAGI